MNVIVEKQLTLDDCNEILFKGRQVSIPAAAFKRVDASHQFLKKFSKNKLPLFRRRQAAGTDTGKSADAGSFKQFVTGLFRRAYRYY
jgi:histidine ammonia-lyase